MASELRTPTLPPSRTTVTRTRGEDLSAGLNGIYTLWRRDLLRFSRDRARIASSLGQPILFLFVFGSGLSSSMGRLGNGPTGLP